MRTMVSPTDSDVSLALGCSQSEDEILNAGSSFGYLSDEDVAVVAAPGGKSLEKTENLVFQLRMLAEKSPKVAELVEQSDVLDEKLSEIIRDDSREDVSPSSKGRDSDADSVNDFLVGKREAVAPQAPRIRGPPALLKRAANESLPPRPQTATKTAKEDSSNERRTAAVDASNDTQLEKSMSSCSSSSRPGHKGITSNSVTRLEMKASDSSHLEQKASSNSAALETKMSTSSNSGRLEKKASTSSHSGRLEKKASSSSRSSRLERKSSTSSKSSQVERRGSISSHPTRHQRKASTSSNSSRILDTASTSSQLEIMQSGTPDLRHLEKKASASSYCSQMDQKTSMASNTSNHSSGSKQSVPTMGSGTQSSGSEWSKPSKGSQGLRISTANHSRDDTVATPKVVLNGPPRSISAGRSPSPSPRVLLNPSPTPTPTPVRYTNADVLDSFEDEETDEESLDLGLHAPPRNLSRDRKESEDVAEKIEADKLQNTDGAVRGDAIDAECDTIDSESNMGLNTVPNAESELSRNDLDPSSLVRERASQDTAEEKRLEYNMGDKAATAEIEGIVSAEKEVNPLVEALESSPRTKSSKRQKFKQFLRKHSNKKSHQHVDPSDAMKLEPHQLQDITEKVVAKRKARFATPLRMRIGKTDDHTASNGHDDEDHKEAFIQKLRREDSPVKQSRIQNSKSVSGMLKLIPRDKTPSKLRSEDPNNIVTKGNSTLLKSGEEGAKQSVFERFQRARSPLKIKLAKKRATEIIGQKRTAEEEVLPSVPSSKTDDGNCYDDSQFARGSAGNAIASDIVTEESKESPSGGGSTTNGSIKQIQEDVKVQIDKTSGESGGKRFSLFQRFARTSSPMKPRWSGPKATVDRHSESQLVIKKSQSSLSNRDEGPATGSSVLEAKSHLEGQDVAQEAKSETTQDSGPLNAQDSGSLHGLLQETEVMDGENETEVCVSFKKSCERIDSFPQHAHEDSFGPAPVYEALPMVALASLATDLTSAADFTHTDTAIGKQFESVVSRVSVHSVPANEENEICENKTVETKDAGSSPHGSATKNKQTVLSRMSRVFSPTKTRPVHTQRETEQEIAKYTVASSNDEDDCLQATQNGEYEHKHADMHHMSVDFEEEGDRANPDTQKMDDGNGLADATIQVSSRKGVRSVFNRMSRAFSPLKTRVQKTELKTASESIVFDYPVASAENAEKNEGLRLFAQSDRDITDDQEGSQSHTFDDRKSDDVPSHEEATNSFPMPQVSSRIGSQNTLINMSRAFSPLKTRANRKLDDADLMELDNLVNSAKPTEQAADQLIASSEGPVVTEQLESESRSLAKTNTSVVPCQEDVGEDFSPTPQVSSKKGRRTALASISHVFSPLKPSENPKQWDAGLMKELSDTMINVNADESVDPAFDNRDYSAGQPEEPSVAGRDGQIEPVPSQSLRNPSGCHYLAERNEHDSSPEGFELDISPSTKRVRYPIINISRSDTDMVDPNDRFDSVEAAESDKDHSVVEAPSKSLGSGSDDQDDSERQQNHTGVEADLFPPPQVSPQKTKRSAFINISRAFSPLKTRAGHKRSNSELIPIQVASESIGQNTEERDEQHPSDCQGDQSAGDNQGESARQNMDERNPVGQRQADPPQAKPKKGKHSAFVNPPQVSPKKGKRSALIGVSRAFSPLKTTANPKLSDTQMVVAPGDVIDVQSSECVGVYSDDRVHSSVVAKQDEEHASVVGRDEQIDQVPPAPSLRSTTENGQGSNPAEKNVFSHEGFEVDIPLSSKVSSKKGVRNIFNNMSRAFSPLKTRANLPGGASEIADSDNRADSAENAESNDCPLIAGSTSHAGQVPSQSVYDDSGESDSEANISLGPQVTSEQDEDSDPSIPEQNALSDNLPSQSLGDEEKSERQDLGTHKPSDVPSQEGVEEDVCLAPHVSVSPRRRVRTAFNHMSRAFSPLKTRNKQMTSETHLPKTASETIVVRSEASQLKTKLETNVEGGDTFVGAGTGSPPNSTVDLVSSGLRTNSSNDHLKSKSPTQDFYERAKSKPSDSAKINPSGEGIEADSIPAPKFSPDQGKFFSRFSRAFSPLKARSSRKQADTELEANGNCFDADESHGSFASCEKADDAPSFDERNETSAEPVHDSIAGGLSYDNSESPSEQKSLERELTAKSEEVMQTLSIEKKTSSEPSAPMILSRSETDPLVPIRKAETIVSQEGIEADAIPLVPTEARVNKVLSRVSRVLSPVKSRRVSRQPEEKPNPLHSRKQLETGPSGLANTEEVRDGDAVFNLSIDLCSPQQCTARQESVFDNDKQEHTASRNEDATIVSQSAKSEEIMQTLSIEKKTSLEPSAPTILSRSETDPLVPIRKAETIVIQEGTEEAAPVQIDQKDQGVADEANNSSTPEESRAISTSEASHAIDNKTDVPIAEESELVTGEVHSTTTLRRKAKTSLFSRVARAFTPIKSRPVQAQSDVSRAPNSDAGDLLDVGTPNDQDGFTDNVDLVARCDTAASQEGVEAAEVPTPCESNKAALTSNSSTHDISNADLIARRDTIVSQEGFEADSVPNPHELRTGGMRTIFSRVPKEKSRRHRKRCVSSTHSVQEAKTGDYAKANTEPTYALTAGLVARRDTVVSQEGVEADEVPTPRESPCKSNKASLTSISSTPYISNDDLVARRDTIVSQEGVEADSVPTPHELRTGGMRTIFSRVPKEKSRRHRKRAVSATPSVQEANTGDDAKTIPGHTYASTRNSSTHDISNAGLVARRDTVVSQEGLEADAVPSLRESRCEPSEAALTSNSSTHDIPNADLVRRDTVASQEGVEADEVPTPRESPRKARKTGMRTIFSRAPKSNSRRPQSRAASATHSVQYGVTTSHITDAIPEVDDSRTNCVLSIKSPTHETSNIGIGDLGARCDAIMSQEGVEADSVPTPQESLKAGVGTKFSRAPEEKYRHQRKRDVSATHGVQEGATTGVDSKAIPEHTHALTDNSFTRDISNVDLVVRRDTAVSQEGVEAGEVPTPQESRKAGVRTMFSLVPKKKSRRPRKQTQKSNTKGNTIPDVQGLSERIVLMKESGKVIEPWTGEGHEDLPLPLTIDEAGNPNPRESKVEVSAAPEAKKCDGILEPDPPQSQDSGKVVNPEAETIREAAGKLEKSKESSVSESKSLMKRIALAFSPTKNRHGSTSPAVLDAKGSTKPASGAGVEVDVEYGALRFEPKVEKKNLISRVSSAFSPPKASLQGCKPKDQTEEISAAVKDVHIDISKSASQDRKRLFERTTSSALLPHISNTEDVEFDGDDIDECKPLVIQNCARETSDVNLEGETDNSVVAESYKNGMGKEDSQCSALGLATWFACGEKPHPTGSVTDEMQLWSNDNELDEDNLYGDQVDVSRVADQTCLNRWSILANECISKEAAVMSSSGVDLSSEENDKKGESEDMTPEATVVQKVKGSVPIGPVLLVAPTPRSTLALDNATDPPSGDLPKPEKQDVLQTSSTSPKIEVTESEHDRTKEKTKEKTKKGLSLRFLLPPRKQSSGGGRSIFKKRNMPNTKPSVIQEERKMPNTKPSVIQEERSDIQQKSLVIPDEPQEPSTTQEIDCVVQGKSQEMIPVILQDKTAPEPLITQEESDGKSCVIDKKPSILKAKTPSSVVQKDHVTKKAHLVPSRTKDRAMVEEIVKVISIPSPKVSPKSSDGNETEEPNGFWSAGKWLSGWSPKTEAVIDEAEEAALQVFPSMSSLTSLHYDSTAPISVRAQAQNAVDETKFHALNPDRPETETAIGGEVGKAQGGVPDTALGDVPNAVQGDQDDPTQLCDNDHDLPLWKKALRGWSSPQKAVENSILFEPIEEIKPLDKGSPKEAIKVFQPMEGRDPDFSVKDEVESAIKVFQPIEERDAGVSVKGDPSVAAGTRLSDMGVPLDPDIQNEVPETSVMVGTSAAPSEAKHAATGTSAKRKKKKKKRNSKKKQLEKCDESAFNDTNEGGFEGNNKELVAEAETSRNKEIVTESETISNRNTETAPAITEQQADEEKQEDAESQMLNKHKRKVSKSSKKMTVESLVAATAQKAEQKVSSEESTNLFRKEVSKKSAKKKKRKSKSALEIEKMYEATPIQPNSPKRGVDASPGLTKTVDDDPKASTVAILIEKQARSAISSLSVDERLPPPPPPPPPPTDGEQSSGLSSKHMFVHADSAEDVTAPISSQNQRTPSHLARRKKRIARLVGDVDQESAANSSVAEGAYRPWWRGSRPETPSTGSVGSKPFDQHMRVCAVSDEGVDSDKTVPPTRPAQGPDTPATLPKAPRGESRSQSPPQRNSSRRQDVGKPPLPKPSEKLTADGVPAPKSKRRAEKLAKIRKELNAADEVSDGYGSFNDDLSDAFAPKPNKPPEWNWGW